MFKWMSFGHHGGGKTNGSQIHLEAQDSVLEKIAMFAQPGTDDRPLLEPEEEAMPAEAPRMEPWPRERFWKIIQAAMFASLVAAAFRGMWVESTLAKELSTVRTRLDDVSREHREFLERNRKRMTERP